MLGILFKSKAQASDRQLAMTLVTTTGGYVGTDKNYLLTAQARHIFTNVFMVVHYYLLCKMILIFNAFCIFPQLGDSVDNGNAVPWTYQNFELAENKF